jgi:hypothetical protein
MGYGLRVAAPSPHQEAMAAARSITCTAVTPTHPRPEAELLLALAKYLEADRPLIQRVIFAGYLKELVNVYDGNPAAATAAPAAPVTTKKMPRSVIFYTIVTQLPVFLESRSEYQIREFREHCKPFLPIGTADLEKEFSGAPKWIERFTYAHNEVAQRRGFAKVGVGKWSVPAGRM